MNTGDFTGVEIIRRVALENSINPYLLLALLEYKSHWVLGNPSNLAEAEYPMGMVGSNNASYISTFLGGPTVEYWLLRLARRDFTN